MKYFIKVKNILGKNKEITLLDNSKYTLKDKDEKIIGEYSIDKHPIIFKLLKAGFEVSKILEENIKDCMLIETESSNEKTSSRVKEKITNKDNKDEVEKPKKRRGRPPKNKS